MQMVGYIPMGVNRFFASGSCGGGFDFSGVTLPSSAGARPTAGGYSPTTYTAPRAIPSPGASSQNQAIVVRALNAGGGVRQINQLAARVTPIKMIPAGRATATSAVGLDGLGALELPSWAPIAAIAGLAFVLLKMGGKGGSPRRRTITEAF